MTPARSGLLASVRGRRWHHGLGVRAACSTLGEPVSGAELLANRLKTEAGDSPEAQVSRAFALLYAREPDAWEKTESSAMIQELGLPAFCRALYNTSEFLFVF